MAFEMGRHIIGYEVQRILAVVDWFSLEKDHPPIGVFGYGEGGLLALYSAASDLRIRASVVSGYFGPREEVYKEPLYRNVWSQLREFGDGELIRLILPRALIVESSEFRIGPPPPVRPGRAGAAPGEFTAPALERARAEIDRIMTSLPPREKFARARIGLSSGVMTAGPQKGTTLPGPGFPHTLARFWEGLGAPLEPRVRARPRSSRATLGSRSIPTPDKSANSISSWTRRKSSFPPPSLSARNFSGRSSTPPRSRSCRNPRSPCDGSVDRDHRQVA